MEKNRKINNRGGGKGGGGGGRGRGNHYSGLERKFFKKVIALHHGDSNFVFYFEICNQIHTFNDNLKGEDLT